MLGSQSQSLSQSQTIYFSHILQRKMNNLSQPSFLLESAPRLVGTDNKWESSSPVRHSYPLWHWRTVPDQWSRGTMSVDTLTVTRVVVMLGGIGKCVGSVTV